LDYYFLSRIKVVYIEFERVSLLHLCWWTGVIAKGFSFSEVAMLKRFLPVFAFISLSIFTQFAYTQTEVGPVNEGSVISKPEYQGKRFLALSALDNRMALQTKNETIRRGIQLVMRERATAICRTMNKTVATSFQVAESKSMEELWIAESPGQFVQVKDDYSWDVSTYPHQTFLSITCR
jgi:hypothetical protein